jgi:hypothetical protein
MITTSHMREGDITPPWRAVLEIGGVPSNLTGETVTLIMRLWPRGATYPTGDEIRMGTMTNWGGGALDATGQVEWVWADPVTPGRFRMEYEVAGDRTFPTRDADADYLLVEPDLDHDWS